jgi:hypothetical protein
MGDHVSGSNAASINSTNLVQLTSSFSMKAIAAL